MKKKHRYRHWFLSESHSISHWYWVRVVYHSVQWRQLSTQLLPPSIECTIFESSVQSLNTAQLPANPFSGTDRPEVDFGVTTATCWQEMKCNILKFWFPLWHLKNSNSFVSNMVQWHYGRAEKHYYHYFDKDAFFGGTIKPSWLSKVSRREKNGQNLKTGSYYN